MELFGRICCCLMTNHQTDSNSLSRMELLQRLLFYSTSYSGNYFVIHFWTINKMFWLSKYFRNAAKGNRSEAFFNYLKHFSLKWIVFFHFCHLWLIIFTSVCVVLATFLWFCKVYGLSLNSEWGYSFSQQKWEKKNG